MLQDGKCINASTAYTTFDCSLFSDFQSIMIAEMGHTNPINVSMVDWYYFDYMRNKATPLNLYLEDIIMHIHRQLHTDNKMVVLFFLVLVLLSATLLINECGISILEPVLFAVNMTILIFVVLNMVFGEGEQLNIIFKHTLHTTLAATSMAASAVFGLLPTKIKTKINRESSPITTRHAMATLTYIAVLGFIVGVGVHVLFFPRYTTGLSKAVSERNYMYEPVSSLHSSGGVYTPLWIDRNSEIDYAVYFKMRNEKQQCDSPIPNPHPSSVPTPTPIPVSISDCEGCLKRVHDVEIQQKSFIEMMTSIEGDLKGVQSDVARLEGKLGYMRTPYELGLSAHIGIFVYFAVYCV
jgi:hypothetical protein